MRFIVDLYRYLIFSLCAFVLIGLTIGLLYLFNHGLLTDNTYGPTAILAVLTGLVLMVLSLGGIAILISIHDRHAEIAEQLGRVADAMERAVVEPQFS